MYNYFQIITLFIFYFLSAQEKKMETVYFNFNKYNLDTQQEQIIYDFIRMIDTSMIESIQIYGYCDDRGNNDYNDKLSKKRVNTVRSILLNQHFNKNKILIIEGKGRVLIKADTIENIKKIRSRNRRVDLLIVNKNTNSKRIFNSLQEKHAVGDRIYFKNILFAMGSSKLSLTSKKVLDKIILKLNKNKKIEFEIQGHVCCTSTQYNDAIDKTTKERNLSSNRAKAVFKYLLNNKISRFRMNYKGYGNKFPLGKGDALDRRVEFLITKV